MRMISAVNVWWLFNVSHTSCLMWYMPSPCSVPMSNSIYIHITVKPVTKGHLKKCPHMTGVPSSQVHFNVKVYFGSQKMRFRHPNLDILVSPRHRFYCIDHMLFYFITGPVGRQHICYIGPSISFFLSFVLCNIKLSNLCNYYFFYLKLKIKSMSMSMSMSMSN